MGTLKIILEILKSVPALVLAVKEIFKAWAELEKQRAKDKKEKEVLDAIEETKKTKDADILEKAFSNRRSADSDGK